jgi:hypothetical protein
MFLYNLNKLQRVNSLIARNIPRYLKVPVNNYKNNVKIKTFCRVFTRRQAYNKIY